jgi:uncharacterized protein YodC (DUF2158 family)
MADKFKKGDVVELKSGGPPMTVDDVPSTQDTVGRPKGYYETKWFRGASKESGRFNEHLLKKFEPPVPAKK